MLKAGLWTCERKRKPYRKRRQRRGHFGELLQLDGSFQKWLEERGPKGCLLNLVDDATGIALMSFTHDETTCDVAELVRRWFEQYGVPRALYTDWKSVCHAPSEREEVAPTIKPIQKHVQEVGHRVDCRQLTTGKRPRGTSSRNA